MIGSEELRMERILLGQERLMDEVHFLLEQEQKHDDILRAAVLSSSPKRVNHIEGQDPERVYHIDAIRGICVKYRLRFLDGVCYKGEIPHAAVHALRRVEERSRMPLAGFKVLAPAARFKLCDSNADPLLFVPIGPKHYYLVHKWGNDMSPMRAFSAWPYRSVGNLALTVLLLALALTLLIPTSWITTDPGAGWYGAHRVVFLAWCTMVCTSFTVFGWFAFFGSFSSENWNSRHFN